MIIAVMCAVRLGAQSPRAAAPYAVVSAEGRRTVGTAMVGDREMLRLDELASLLQLTVREDRATKALTVSRGTTVVVLSLDQGLASVGGKIISLSAPPAKDGSRWLVPPDTVSRAILAHRQLQHRRQFIEPQHLLVADRRRADGAASLRAHDGVWGGCTQRLGVEPHGAGRRDDQGHGCQSRTESH